MKKPVAFMSYAHRDDKSGRLTELCEHLSEEVSVQTGEDFEVFQDRDAILWGQNWKERIENSLDEVTFLIAIITPSFFRSPHCRNELKRFIDREKKLDRNDLILPIYYVDTSLINDEAKRATDELAQIIATRQYVDWRDLRTEPLTSPQVVRKLSQLGSQIRDALDRVLEAEASLTRGGNVELREPCLGLSEELFRFVGERDKGDPNSTTWIADASDVELNEYSHKSVQYMNETMHLYDQKYAGRVMSLFEILEQRGLWYPKNLSSEERKRIQDPGTPYDIRAIARNLSRIGHRLDEGLSQWNNEEHQTENGQTSSEMEPPTEKLTSEERESHIDDLRRRCRELAEDLRQFLEDHQGKDRDEIMRLYRRNVGNRNFADEASVLLEELEEYGLYPPKNLKSFEISANAYPRSPMAINRLATTLGTIGRRGRRG